MTDNENTWDKLLHIKKSDEYMLILGWWHHSIATI